MLLRRLNFACGLQLRTNGTEAERKHGKSLQLMFPQMLVTNKVSYMLFTLKANVFSFFCHLQTLPVA